MLTWRTSAAAAVGALALIGAGCGASDGNGDAGAAGTGAGTSAQGVAAKATDQVITVNWGAEPPSLDPGLATDTTSSNILLNIMDPLVRLGKGLQPVPSLARSWDVSKDGRTVTFHLRSDGRWTDGSKVTARDFEWSWKRTISPELAADYAYQFYGIVGAQQYNSCKTSCASLRSKVGITAVNATTLRVKLVSPQPWFIQQVAHHSFLAVPRKAVEKFGEKWTEAQNIVTDGPFRLADWKHDSRIDLVKWDGWRNAKQVALKRVNGRMISDGITAVQAFENGEVDVLYQGLPVSEISRLKGEPTYQQYPALGVYYYGINVKNVPDVEQRRAMALAIDRQAIIDNITQADQLPATGFTPKGMSGFDQINPRSPWLPPKGNMDEAKKLMEQVKSPKKTVTIFVNDSPGHREIAVAVQAMWKQLGIDTKIRQQEWAQFLEFLGPPPNKAVDVYRNGWIADYVDANNFLELWTCNSGNNNANFCDKRYDRLHQRVVTGDVTGEQNRYRLYGQMERLLFGPNGDMPIIPLYWYTYSNLEKPSVKATFDVNPLNQTDLTKVRETDATA